MNSLVIYYSRSGNTRAVAEKLAGKLDADLEAIVCDRYSNGWLGYARAGYDSLRKALPEIVPIKANLAAYDILVLGSPIWTSYPATPVRSFLAQHEALPDRVAVFFTQGGQSAPKDAARGIADLIAQEPAAVLSIMGTSVASPEADQQIDSFAQGLFDETQAA